MRSSSWLVDQLPVTMTEDDGYTGDNFLRRFLYIFQDLSDSVLVQVDNLGHLADVGVTPPGMVRTIGGWFGLDWMDPDLDPSTGISEHDHVQMQRELVRTYLWCVQRRGTKAALTRLLKVLTGGDVQVIDQGGVFAEGEVPADRGSHVRIEVERLGPWARTPAAMARIIRGEVPASVTFDLHVRDDDRPRSAA